MRPDEYAKCDAVELATLVEKGDITPHDMLAVSTCIIEDLNPVLNAVVTHMTTESAAFAETDLSATAFKGVPAGMKDDESIHYGGVPTTNANKLCAQFTPDEDSTLTKRYKAAGLNFIAKTNMPEFSASVTTESSMFGPCKNPWNTLYNAGGSSGGSACGVASGMFPLAYGNDGAGSIRIPASYCGVFGMKPTRGRMPKGPHTNEEWSGLVADNMISRSVRDTALIMDLTAGTDTGAPYSAPPHDSSFRSHVGRVTAPFKIGLLTETFSGDPVHPDCRKAAEETAKLCESLGHRVEPAKPQGIGDNVFNIIKILMQANSAYGFTDLFKIAGVTPDPKWMDHTNYRLYELGLSLKATDFVGALKEMVPLCRQSALFFEEYDFLLTPVTKSPTVQNGEITPEDTNFEHFLHQFIDNTPFTPFTNITGQPAMSMPLFMNADGMPVGSHFVAAFGREDKLFQIAGQLEEAMPWKDRLPFHHALRL